MFTHVVLLRAINLGSHNRVSMPVFKEILTGLGCSQVETYVQSGNAVVTYSRPKPLDNSVSQAITASLGHQITTIVRTAADFSWVIANNPFQGQEYDSAFLHATFLAESPAADTASQIPLDWGGEDQWKLDGSVIYLYTPGGYGRTKLTNSFFERKLGVAATTRNWKTVTALHEMLKD